MAFSSGEMVNFQNIARECGIDNKTVQNYYQILVDTLLGYFVLPYHKNAKRKTLSKTPKFYLFDVGMTQYLTRSTINTLKGAQAGKAFEHFIFMELIAYHGMKEKRTEINYWRTHTGLEVDFILNSGNIAIECKINQIAQKKDLKGIITYAKEYQPKHAIVVSQDNSPRLLTVDEKTCITILPWQLFLKKLWANEFF